MKKNKAVIGVIGLFAVFSIYAFTSTLNPYMTFAQAAESKSMVQVFGFILEDSIYYDLEKGHLVFYLEDEEGTRAKVTYKGVKPANMEHAESIVVLGQFDSDIFVAKRILVKCPSKYEEERKDTNAR